MRMAHGCVGRNGRYWARTSDPQLVASQRLWALVGLLPALPRLRGGFAGEPVAFGDPGREASARRREPGGELSVERGDLAAKLEDAKVEDALAVADVLLGCAMRNPVAALDAGREARFRGDAEHQTSSTLAAPVGSGI